MTGLIVSGHNQFATGLLSSMKLIAGEQEAVVGVDFSEEDSTDDLKGKLVKAMEGLGDDIIILTDLPGGSPNNISVMLKCELSNKNIEVLAGTNLSMLLTAALERSFVNLDELTERILEEGKQAVSRFVLQARKEKPVAEDGI